VLQALVGKYLDDIRSAQDELQLTKEQFESEINIRNRLVQLHEAKATEAGSKASELEGHARSLPSSPRFVWRLIALLLVVSSFLLRHSGGGAGQGLHVVHQAAV
jgi:hypothetical protein